MLFGLACDRFIYIIPSEHLRPWLLGHSNIQQLHRAILLRIFNALHFDFVDCKNKVSHDQRGFRVSSTNIALNKYYKNAFPRKNFKTELHEEVETDIICPFLKESIINELATLHSSLCESIDLINNCFSVQVTADLASVMFYNIFCLFGIYHLIMAKATVFEEIALCLLNTSWNVYYTVFTSIMVACCGMVTEEVSFI